MKRGTELLARTEKGLDQVYTVTSRKLPLCSVSTLTSYYLNFLGKSYISNYCNHKFWKWHDFIEGKYIKDL